MTTKYIVPTMSRETHIRELLHGVLLFSEEGIGRLGLDSILLGGLNVKRQPPWIFLPVVRQHPPPKNSCICVFSRFSDILEILPAEKLGGCL